jgi:hypothetical protein
MKRSPLTAVLFTALLAGALAGPAEAQDHDQKPQAQQKPTRGQVLQRAVNLARQAKADYDAGKYQPAAAKCEQVISMVSRSPNTHYLHEIGRASCRERV